MLRSPTSVKLSEGYTAFVGLNNAGKSTIMRFLLELRPIFQQMRDSTVQCFAERQSLQPNQIIDPEEIFSNLNDDGLSFWLDFSYSENENHPRNPSKVVFEVPRNRQWAVTAFIGNDKINFATTPRNFAEQNGEMYFNSRATLYLYPLRNLMRRLVSTLYVGPFRNTINIGTKSDYLDIEIVSCPL